MPAIHYGKSYILKEADYYYHLFADDEWEEFLEKLKEDQVKHTKWVMGEKIVFDEGKQRVKQQENVDIQRKMPLPMYIGKRGIYETI